MEIDTGVAAFSAAVLFVAYIVRGIAGFGSGLISVPLLALFFPLQLVVPIIVLLDYVGSASQGLRNRKLIAWREQLPLIPFTLIGVAIGLSLLEKLNSATLAQALGVFIMVYAVYQLLPLPVLRGSRLFAVPGGALGGLIGTVFGAGGAVLHHLSRPARAGQERVTDDFRCEFSHRWRNQAGWLHGIRFLRSHGAAVHRGGFADRRDCPLYWRPGAFEPVAGLVYAHDQRVAAGQRCGAAVEVLARRQPDSGDVREDGRSIRSSVCPRSSDRRSLRNPDWRWRQRRCLRRAFCPGGAFPSERSAIQAGGW